MQKSVLSHETDPELYDGVQELLERMQQDYPHMLGFAEIYVIESDEIQAYHHPRTGDIFITRGLIDAFSTEEVVAIVAHEYGHVIENASVRDVTVKELPENASLQEKFDARLEYYGERRCREYKADFIASQYTNPDDLISTLEKVKTMDDRKTSEEHFSYELRQAIGMTEHPQLDDRIGALRGLSDVEYSGSYDSIPGFSPDCSVPDARDISQTRNSARGL